jgi:replicative DNA helicase
MLEGSYTLGKVGGFAMKLFRVGTGERPDLIRTGIAALDATVGGLFPGTLVIIGAEQGVGKSSLILSALLSSPDPVGAIFLEDGPDLVGSRCLAYYSGVNSLDLRFSHRLTPGDVLKLEAAQKKLEEAGDRVSLEFCLGGSIEEIEERVKRLGEKGSKVVYLDYLHKVRGVNDNRRSEIGQVMTRFQRACQAIGAVPIMAAQLSRLNPTEKNPEPRLDEPMVSRLKESGDLESEARVIIMAWPDELNNVKIRLSKSSFGGEGVKDFYRRDESGTLRTKKVASEWSVR